MSFAGSKPYIRSEQQSLCWHFDVAWQSILGALLIGCSSLLLSIAESRCGLLCRWTIWWIGSTCSEKQIRKRSSACHRGSPARTHECAA
jgi:hypothetical protein